ncbi:hypothetical protein GDO78_002998 [Eleutherodactylus coqui]|uniref:Secreted protein n=1 Tax=Eleutherodactylus coqui TaxID=57060 RepID=A0A8J6K5L7_ELECQ|nr:hypothetical protein GDO78_002998 [Eleutherodactylus coqui]
MLKLALVHNTLYLIRTVLATCLPLPTGLNCSPNVEPSPPYFLTILCDFLEMLRLVQGWNAHGNGRQGQIELGLHVQ